MSEIDKNDDAKLNWAKVITIGLIPIVLIFAAFYIAVQLIGTENYDRIVSYVKTQGEPDYLDESIFEDEPEPEPADSAEEDFEGSDADLYEKAKQICFERKGASASYLQRRLSIGYNRAARLVEQMEEEGIVGPANGSKPREILRYE